MIVEAHLGEFIPARSPFCKLNSVSHATVSTLDTYKLKGYLCTSVTARFSILLQSSIEKFLNRLEKECGFHINLLGKLVSLVNVLMYVVPVTWPMAKVSGVL